MKPENKEQAQKRLAGYGDHVNQVMAAWKVPGMAVAIVMDGEVIFAEGFGHRDVKNDLPVTAETLFAIGSSSKAFTAATVGIAVDDGKLDWDKPVRTWLPEFTLYDPIATEHMTPRDLLCHRSGLPRHEFSWYGSPRTREEILAALRYLEPNREFRYTFQYQNLMYMTAGYLAGKAYGISWEELTRKRILDPLGMTSTNFSVETSKASGNYSLPHMEKDGKVIEVPFRNIDQIGPAGSINSNVLEMAKWIVLHLNKGKAGDVQVISESSLRQCHEPILRCDDMFPTEQFPEMGKSSYSMGWFHQRYRGEDWTHHGGGIDGFITLVSFLPRQGIGIVVLSNSSSAMAVGPATVEAFDRLLGCEKTDWNRRMLDMFTKQKEAMEKSQSESVGSGITGTRPSHPLPDYAGEYEFPGYGLFEVKLEAEQLTAWMNQMTLPLTHVHYDQFDFTIPGVNAKFRASFLTDGKGHVDRVSIPLEPSVKDIVFFRRAAKEMTEESFLQKFTGNYEVLGMTITVSLKGGRLVTQIPGQGEADLEPYRGTEFKVAKAPNVSIEFKVDSAGNVPEAAVNQGGMTLIAKRKA